MSQSRCLKNAVSQTSKLALFVTSSKGKILVLGSMIILSMCLSASVGYKGYLDSGEHGAS